LAQALEALVLLMGSEALESLALWLVAPVGIIVVPSIALYLNSKAFYGSLALYGVLWVALGYVLWSRKGKPSGQEPPRVR
jgi:ATP/ADP translocase